MQTIAIIGASNNREKYGNKAVRAYQDAGWRVFPVNPNEQRIEGLEVYKRYVDIPETIDRVSIYLHPEHTMEVLEEFTHKKPREIFLNPGSENRAVLERAEELKLDFVVSCSIVAIGLSPSQYR